MDLLRNHVHVGYVDHLSFSLLTHVIKGIIEFVHVLIKLLFILFHCNELWLTVSKKQIISSIQDSQMTLNSHLLQLLRKFDQSQQDHSFPIFYVVLTQL